MEHRYIRAVPYALFVADGRALVPTELTQGPWSQDAQHGGPVAALLARTAESCESDVPMQVVRLTVELLRPVPLRPLVATSALRRPGRRVQLVDVTLTADDTEVAVARALRIRSTPLKLPELPVLDPPSPPDGVLAAAAGQFRVPYAEAVELRFVDGGWDLPGPVRMWTRLRVPVVAGESPSPLQRTAAAADFGNGVSWVLEFDRFLFINPDLTVSLSRPPDGEWIGFDVASEIAPDGYGQAVSGIFDRHGSCGRAAQSLFVDAR